LAVNLALARPRLIDELDRRVMVGELLHKLVQRDRFVRDITPETHLPGTASICNGNGNRIQVNIQTDKSFWLRHELIPRLYVNLPFVDDHRQRSLSSE
jgi:hypothetical protein